MEGGSDPRNGNLKPTRKLTRKVRSSGHLCFAAIFSQQIPAMGMASLGDYLDTLAPSGSCDGSLLIERNLGDSASQGRPPKRSSSLRTLKLTRITR